MEHDHPDLREPTGRPRYYHLPGYWHRPRVLPRGIRLRLRRMLQLANQLKREMLADQRPWPPYLLSQKARMASIVEMVRPKFRWLCLQYLLNMTQDPGRLHVRERLIRWLPRLHWRYLNHMELVVRSFSRPNPKMTEEEEDTLYDLWAHGNRYQINPRVPR